MGRVLPARAAPAARPPAAPRHAHTDLLHALATAQAVLHAPTLALALAGIDFDLPPGAPNADDRPRLKAAAPLYFAHELERAGLLPTAELIAGLFASGAITQPLGPAAQLLHGFWRGRRERLEAQEREALFGRVIESPHFERLMRALCEAIVAQADGDDMREQVLLATHAQALAGFLAQRMDAMAAIAAQDIVAAINAALAILRDRLVQAAFSVRDLWSLLAVSGNEHGVGATDARNAAERGRNGQTVLLWLSDHASEDVLRLDPAQAADAAILASAQRWLAAQPLGAMLPRVGAALPASPSFSSFAPMV